MLKFIITCIAFDIYPGMTFFYVGNTTVRYGFYAGVFSAIGVAICDFFSGIFAVFGVLRIMEMNPYIRILMRMISCSYFFYLMVSNFVSSFKKTEKSSIEITKQSKLNSIFKGFVIAVTNPGVIMGDALVILQFTNEFTFVKQFFYIILFAVISFGCFVFVSFLFSHKKIRDRVIKKDYYLKRFSALVMAIIFYSIFKDLIIDLQGSNLAQLVHDFIDFTHH